MEQQGDGAFARDLDVEGVAGSLDEAAVLVARPGRSLALPVQALGHGFAPAARAADPACTAR